MNLSKMKEGTTDTLVDRPQFSTWTSTRLIKVHLTPEKLDLDVARMIPERMARAFCLLAIAKEGDTLIVAAADPFDIVAFDTLSAHTHALIQPVQADREELLAAIEEVYSFNQTLLELVTMPSTVQEEEKSDSELKVEADDAPVVQLVNLILLQAAKSGASDIHIEPRENTLSVRLRIDGILHDITPPPKSLLHGVVSRIKILASMDIAERRLSQDGRARLKFENKEIDLRVNTLPTVHGEKVVIRLLDKSNLFTDITQLGFDEWSLKVFLDAIQRPHGMVYLTGPTGSGKTTTLYSALQYLNARERNIVTVEEPVEYELDGINQVQVRTDIGLTFAAVLRATLRQDPDVIMVGETRDLETAEIAVRAALTGHLVFSTLHTNDAPSSITRLIDLGIQPFLVSSALNLVVAQRLVRRICPDCKIEAFLTPEVIERAMLYGGVTIPERVFMGAGCTACNKTGYRGRLAIHEFLPLTGRIKEVLLQGGGEAELRAETSAMGLATLLESGLAKAAQGLTTVDEIFKATLGE